MARPRARLIDRGRLYAHKRVTYVQVFNEDQCEAERERNSAAWVAGYRAAQNDDREKRRGKSR